MKLKASFECLAFLLVFVLCCSVSVSNPKGSLELTSYKRIQLSSKMASSILEQTAQPVRGLEPLSLNKAREQMFFTAVPIALAILHFLLFVFYPRSIENLYYSFFVVFMGLQNYMSYLPDTVELFLFLRLFVFIMCLFGLLFAYTVVYSKIQKQFFIFVFISVFMYSWMLIDPRATDSSLFFAYIIVFLIEFVRTIVSGILKKIRGMWIIGVGAIIVCTVAVYESMMDILNFRALFGVEDPGVYGTLVFLISMSAYLSWKFARTNISLEKRSKELQQLNIELEDRVAQRTKELAEANKILEKQNLDLSESRNEIQVAHIELLKAHEELNQTQALLVQSEKMASLGTMAAGVAHEINTPVGAVSSASDTSRRSIDKVIETIDEGRDLDDIKKDSKFKLALENLKNNNDVIVMASERITKIVKSLRSFARLDEAEFKEADIHEGLDSTLTLLHHKTKDKIEIVKDYGDLPQIQCYPHRLNQVFMNILNNASQAILDKGTIKIETSKKKNEIYVKIIDDGEGIKKEILKKIFDPGFTTRGVGVGTGLGLSISYNIIKDHNGEIKVKSEEGKGTEVIIILPIKQTEAK